MTKEITEHPTFTRFMTAAATLKNVTDQADIARQLNLLDQHLTNWKMRGIPKPRMLELAQWLGCDPYWLKDGTGEMKPISYKTLSARQVTVLKVMEKMNEDQQETLLRISNTLST